MEQEVTPPGPYNYFCVFKLFLVPIADAFHTGSLQQIAALLVVFTTTVFIRKFDKSLSNAMLLLILFYVILYNGDKVAGVFNKVSEILSAKPQQG